MKKIFLLLILSSNYLFAQTDSLKFFFVNSDYKRIIEFSQQENFIEQSDLSDIRYISYAYKTIGDYRSAIRIIEEYEKSHPPLVELTYLKAEYFYKYGRSNESVNLLKNLLKTDKSNSKYMLLLEQIYKSKKNYFEALKLVHIMYMEDSLNIFLNYKMAYYNTKLKQYDTAIFFLNNTLELDSTYVDAWRWKGKIYSAYMKHDSALFFINKALGYEPRNLKIIEERANINYRKGHYFRAQNDYQQLVDAKQSDLNIRYKIGVCYFQMRQPQKALDVLSELYQIDSTNYLYAEYLGATFQKLGDSKKASYYLNKSIELLQPDHLVLASIYRQLANLYFETGEKNKMDKVIKQFYLHSSDTYLLFSIANKYDKDGQKSLALEYYKRLSMRKDFPKTREFERVKNRIQMLKEDLFFEKK